jgi:hypothetical protein
MGASCNPPRPSLGTGMLLRADPCGAPRVACKTSIFRTRYDWMTHNSVLRHQLVALCRPCSQVAAPVPIVSRGALRATPWPFIRAGRCASGANGAASRVQTPMAAGAFLDHRRQPLQGDRAEADQGVTLRAAWAMCV